MSKYTRPKDFDCTIGGQEWRIVFVSRRQISKDRVGDCDWEKRIIRVRYDQPEREFIDTLIHEIEHGKTLLHFSSERWVTQVSSEVTQVLLRAGIGRK